MPAAAADWKPRHPFGDIAVKGDRAPRIVIANVNPVHPSSEQPIQRTAGDLEFLLAPFRPTWGKLHFFRKVLADP